MTHRQPKLPLAFRIIAAGCVVLWLAGVSACSLETLFCGDAHGHEAAGPTNERPSHREHEAEANPSHDVEGHSHGSHKHESKEDSCCSTLKAVVPTAKPFIFNKPAFAPIPGLCVLLETHAAALALSENRSNRQAKGRDWVFTPEVCLGPAFRSLAPPAFV